MRLRYGENFAGSTQAIRYGETVTPERRHAQPSIRPAMCSARRRSRSSATAAASSPPATTRTSPIRPARRSSWCRCDVFITEATFGLPVFRHPDAGCRDRKAAAFGRAVSRARASGRRLFARQGAAGDRAASARPAIDEPIYLHGAMEKIIALLLRAAASISANCGRCARHEEGRARRHHHALPAFGAEGSLVAPLSRSGHRLCLGLDAGARPRAPESACELPLVISDHADWDGLRDDHRGHRRRRNLGHAWAGRRARALVRAAGLKARPLDIVGYGDEDETDGVADAGEAEDRA